MIYVTHRLGEVFEIADRVTIMRNGHSLPPQLTSDLTMDKVIEGIVGRPLEEMYPARPDSFGEIVLTIDKFSADGLPDPVTMHVRQGEILGLAGQAGSGTATLLASHRRGLDTDRRSSDVARRSHFPTPTAYPTQFGAASPTAPVTARPTASLAACRSR